MPGAENLVRQLHARGVPMAVATSSTRRSFNMKRKNHRSKCNLRT